MSRETEEKPVIKESTEGQRESAENVSKQSTAEMDSLVAQQKAEMDYQKSSDRPAGVATNNFGKLEFTDSSAAANVETAAEQIHKASQGFGTDEESIHKALEGKSPEELKQLNDLYKQQYGMSLEDQMTEELSGAELERAMKPLRDAGVASFESKDQASDYENLTPDDKRAMAEYLDEHFNEMDADGDGVVSPVELARHIRNLEMQDPTNPEIQTLKKIYAHITKISEEKNDQWGRQDTGISREDATRFRNRFPPE
jgi:hypothetical protein